jgi:tetratricopeptide (TPR) repeat protein
MRQPGQLTAGGLPAIAALFLGLVLSGPLSAQQPAAPTACDQARALAAEGRAKQAIDLLDRAAASGYRTAELYDLRGQLSLATGDAEAAERDWRRAAQLDPTAARPRLQLGRLYARRGLWADAIAYYREILLTDPRNADAVLGLAEAYEKSGRRVGAQKLLQAASEAIDDRRIHERWARMAREAGRPEDAERALRRIAVSAQGAAKRDALLALAELYLAEDDPERALTAAREALAVERPAGEMSAETYDAIALATDHEVAQIGEGLGAVLAALEGGSLAREEAFSAATALRSRLTEAEGLLAEVGAPEARRSAQTQRAFAYALAAEAALNALVSVDLGLPDRREAFNARMAEARAEIARLSPATQAP